MRSAMPEFVIPSDKDQLLQTQPGKYSVRNVYPLRDIQNILADTNAILQEEGPSFLLEHFDKFFSVLVHGSNLKIPVHLLAVDRIHKCLKMFTNELEKQYDRGREPAAEDKPQLLTITNMLAYLLSSLIRHIEIVVSEESAGGSSKQRKKVSSKTDWELKWYDQIDEILVQIYHWIQLPLEKLWQPPIADGSFIKCISEICYRVLERCKNVKDKSVRESIFQILGTLVKRYNHSISFVIKVVQLVKMCDGLAVYLATGIIEVIEQTKYTGIIKEILREVDRATPEEGGTRNIATFLDAITSSKPNLILPAVSNLTDHLANECYLMRNCVIGILGTIVKEILTSEDLSEDQKTTRDECLENLMDHLLDTNAFVRSKTLQVWQYLCTEGAVPLVNQNALLTAVIHRLNDKNAIVRKYAFQLLRTLLQCNPFAGKFNLDKLTQQLADAKKKLKTLRIRFASISKPGAKIRVDIWNALAPSIQSAISNICVEEHMECEEDILSELDSRFENLRQLLFQEKIREALEQLMSLSAKLPESFPIDTMTPENKEEFLMSVLHKVFIDSQEVQIVTENQGSGDIDQQMKEYEKEKETRKEDYATQARLVEYIKNCLIFATELSKAIPVAEIQLSSISPSDAIEACSFLGIACQFNVEGAKDAMRKALRQVYSSDVSVCENLAKVYTELYIRDSEQYTSERHKALVIAKALIKMVKSLEPGESPALTKLITLWREKEVISAEVFRVLWERFSLKLTDTLPEESRAALMLLTMASTTESAVVTGNFDILVSVGLGPRAETDLLLARDTCRAMTKVAVQNPDPLKCPSRLPNEHEVFEKILLLLVNKFQDIDETCYTTFSTEAINAIYHLADQPDLLMKQMLSQLVKNFQLANGTIHRRNMPSAQLANLLHVVGHIAIRQMIHLDMHVYKELKRRNTLIEMVKMKRKGDINIRNIADTTARSIRDGELDTPSSASRMRRLKDTSTIEDNGQEAIEGATADDSDAEFIHNVLENEVVSGNGLLAKFVPMVLDVCQHPEKYTDEDVQISGSLALSKMMTVSSLFCKEYLQLLITIMERSPYPSNRANLLVGVTDLMNRFPNEVEPWTKHVYGRLRDESPLVRRTCVKMLSNLIMKEMVRVKGQVSELALCVNDPEEDIRQETIKFFNELANKGNALYNIMPDILSRLTDCDLKLDEDKFQHIIKFVLGLLQKEKQIDAIIEKVCIRFKLATTERQWRDLAYCLSLLKFNAKGIRRLVDNLHHMKDKIHHEPVFKVLNGIVDQARKKTETKAACLELEEKLKQMLDGNDKENEKPDSDAAIMPPPPTTPRQLTTSRQTATPRQARTPREATRRSSRIRSTPRNT
ncbi:condensin complex subunit 1 [Neodiprion fabricii]|uniref:condensin complex subunit 1 n=1 Tax=Neodiprion fabricii TaxID=2872261 RepID=UPI001ED95AAC|nr:condensin complex subunit 1 [Neodiprion fabricii]